MIGDDALTFHTQIERALGLRSRFAETHGELDSLAPPPSTAGPEACASLERDRVWRSSENPVEARPRFVQAFEIARAAGLPALAVDALP